MLPTCPFRDFKDIQKAFRIFKKTDSLVSVCKYNFPPELALIESKNKYAKYFIKKSPYLTGKTKSQNFKSVFRPNGGIYISNIKKLKKKLNLFLKEKLNFIKCQYLDQLILIIKLIMSLLK